MKDIQTRRRFVELRSQGWCLKRIAQELNVSRRALVNWTNLYEFEIQNLRAIEVEALREKLLKTREDHAIELADQLHRIESEILKRNLTDIPTARLFAVSDLLRRQISRTLESTKFTPALDENAEIEKRDRINRSRFISALERSELNPCTQRGEHF